MPFKCLNAAEPVTNPTVLLWMLKQTVSLLMERRKEGVFFLETTDTCHFKTRSTGLNTFLRTLKRTMCIADYIQTTFFYLERFLNNSADDQCSSV